MMKLHSVNFGLAAALTAAVIWIFCSLIVLSAPQLTMMLSGSMVHMDTSHMMWSMSFMGFLYGLFIWSLTLGFTAWLFAALYNRLCFD
jgi:hypothetical protein